MEDFHFLSRCFKEILSYQ